MRKFNLELFKADLKEVLLKHGASLSVTIEGDTHGISTFFEVDWQTVHGRDSEVLNEYDTTLSASDL